MLSLGRMSYRERQGYTQVPSATLRAASSLSRKKDSYLLDKRVPSAGFSVVSPPCVSIVRESSEDLAERVRAEVDDDAYRLRFREHAAGHGGGQFCVRAHAHTTALSGRPRQQDSSGANGGNRISMAKSTISVFG